MDGSLRMCIDSRAINKITIKYHYPITRLDDMLDELNVSKSFISHFVVVYFDDILIYSKNLKEHVEHLRRVFEVFRREKLFVNLKKCRFCQDDVVFLGYVVSQHGIEVNEEKIKAIREWPTPTTISEMRNFHGLASFYKRFMKNLSSILASSTKCIKKGNEFKWNEAAQCGSELFKEKLCVAYILVLPDFSKTFKIDCNAFGVRIKVVLMQERQPIAYFSDKLSGASLNCST
ncbi:uncharacterized protein LOC116193683 [Punica granatum]|uniref:Uncharacterized protein LOC116193683 n=1 Tax=Punica granatum TaxID=22663 RepID=A0A6P8C686_PUNGR|nr:uncharacterized protein LOC116193683 [Punica granatum]